MQELGAELADGDLTTLAMLYLGDVARRRRRYATAVTLLSASEAQARTATAATRGRRWQTLARAHAECGQQSPFLNAIDQAEACAEEVGAGGTGITADSFTATQVRHERAHGLTLLGEARAALAIYEAEPVSSFQGVRDRANFLIIKAQALAGAGSLDEGVRLAIEGLLLARGYGSPRHVSRVQRMHERLQRTIPGTNPHLARLRDALAAA